MAAEQAVAYVIPNGTGTPELARNEGEIWIRELPGGVVEVHDPLFEEPYRFGDQSLVKDWATDQIAVEFTQHFLYMMSSRQMGHTERNAIMDGGGRMARLPHMLACAALAVRYNGTPREITTMLVHDAPHRMHGHPDDHLIRSAGPHTAHDADQVGFLYRSGFVERLQARGLCDDSGMLANGVHVSELAVQEDDGSGILSYSTISRLLDLDRWGYNLMQEATTPGGVARARMQLADVSRVNDPVHGDQLVFGSSTYAEDFCLRQADRWYRYWASQENLALSQLSQMLTRHVLTSDSPLAEPYRQYFPGDALRGLPEDWQDTILAMAETDPGVRGLLKIIDGIVAHVRHHNALPRDIHAPYQGPSFPSWAIRHTIRQKLADTAPTFYQGRTTQFLVIRTNAGKERLVDPFVNTGDNLARAYAAMPGVKEQIDRDDVWALTGFGLTIDLKNRDLGLNPSEIAAIKKMTAPGANKKWQKALERPLMSPEQLRAHIEGLNERYRQIGAVSLDGVAEIAG